LIVVVWCLGAFTILSGIIMHKDLTKSITSKIIELQDKNGCWNVLDKSDKRYPALNYYVPIYNATLWTLVLLADIQCDIRINSLIKPLETISNHFLDKNLNIYSLGKTHFPIPCLNGNMLYLHSYFNFERKSVVAGIIDFFAEYQRFDDGDSKIPSSFPYRSNRACYGKHTCYWGVMKLFKGLSFIPKNKRSTNADRLIEKCIDFILLHKVCFRSHDDSQFIHTNIKKLTFPNMYQADYLEILWLLKREKVESVHIGKALNLLKSKMKPDLTWKIERQIKNLIVPIGNNIGNEFITKRAKEVIDYYGK
jgi:hypothetical protein